MNQQLEPIYIYNNTSKGNQLVGFDPTMPSENWYKMVMFNSILSAAHVTACGARPSRTQVVNGVTVFLDGWNGGDVTTCDMTAVVQEQRDFYVNATKPSALTWYTPYIYPHPLQKSVIQPPQNLRVY